MPPLALTEKERRSLLAFAQRLIATPSLPGNEGAIASVIIDEMRDLGYDDVAMDPTGNVLGRLGSGLGPTLMLNSHMDTVEPATPQAWQFDPWTPRVRDGHLYGLGACDMKAGLAATVHAPALLAARGWRPNGTVLVACVGLEEPSEGTCTRMVFEEAAVCPDWVVIAEPSDLNVVRAQRGHVEMLLTVHGRSAHSSAPELGDNAIYTAARLIFGLEILAGQLMTDPFLGPGVLAVTEIHSHAVSRNAVPDSCTLFLDRRLTVGETEASALLEVQRVIAREGVRAEVSVVEEDVQSHTGVQIRARRASLPWALDERHPLVQAMAAAARQAGLRPSITRWSFATEGAYTAAVAQVPTVGFGPGDPSLPHRPNERVRIDQIYAAAQVYARLADALLGGA